MTGRRQGQDRTSGTCAMPFGAVPATLRSPAMPHLVPPYGAIVAGAFAAIQQWRSRLCVCVQAAGQIGGDEGGTSDASCKNCASYHH